MTDHLTERVQEKIFSRPFFILSFATLCFFCSQSSLIPVLPRHLKALGASSLVVGLVVGSMVFPAVILRPLVGKQIDRRGRRIFIWIGLVVGTVCSFGYTLAPN
ncbi:MAG: MFS transporter, partial [Actinobacteria bacterium]|nr:MFS transporter [Actinomycetota bacterium]